MPELPEVETIRRTLEEKLTGLIITEVTIYRPEVIKKLSAKEFKELVQGQKITGFGRRGKYLLIHLGGKNVLAVHLRMTGQLVCKPACTPAKHTHVVFRLEKGYELHFTDTRRFGRIVPATADTLQDIPGLKDLGIEPLSENFTPGFLRRELRKHRTKLKNLLLDQTFIAGLGNIYADEALFRARLNPSRASNTLNTREITRLHKAIKEVLQEGIKYRGTTFSDYLDGSGEAGSFQRMLRVYGREGHPCTRCKYQICRIKLSGRSTYYCPNCQKSVK